MRDEIIGCEEDFDGYAGNNLMDPEDIERAKQKIRDARKLTAAEILDIKDDKGDGDDASDDSGQHLNKMSAEMQDLFDMGDTKGQPTQQLSKKEKRAQKKQDKKKGKDANAAVAEDEPKAVQQQVSAQSGPAKKKQVKAQETQLLESLNDLTRKYQELAQKTNQLQ